MLWLHHVLLKERVTWFITYIQLLPPAVVTMTHQDTLHQDNHNMMTLLLARRIENREVFGSNPIQDKYMYHSHVSR